MKPEIEEKIKPLVEKLRDYRVANDDKVSGPLYREREHSLIKAEVIGLLKQDDFYEFDSRELNDNSGDYLICAVKYDKTQPVWAVRIPLKGEIEYFQYADWYDYFAKVNNLPRKSDVLVMLSRIKGQTYSHGHHSFDLIKMLEYLATQCR